jgi:hypothetical protein
MGWPSSNTMILIMIFSHSRELAYSIKENSATHLLVVFKATASENLLPKWKMGDQLTIVTQLSFVTKDTNKMFSQQRTRLLFQDGSGIQVK